MSQHFFVGFGRRYELIQLHFFPEKCEFLHPRFHNGNRAMNESKIKNNSKRLLSAKSQGQG
jgi:hypothetical protein